MPKSQKTQTHRRLGKTGFKASAVGFGGYRVTDQDPGHAAALKLALTSGCNLIDTSTNYGDGHSEALVGTVVKDLIGAGRLTRDEVFIVSKAGYLQGTQLRRAERRASEGNPFPEVVQYQEGLWHCIAPEFLEDQLTQSLKRLQLEKLDALLLHNPEYFLKAGGDHSQYYARIEKAFAHLEREVARGRIRYYGVSSNTFVEPREAAAYTSLETLLEIAERGGGKHFALIQFPFNLFEPGAVLETNNSGKTVAALAASRGLGTLINRPLNSFQGRQLLRLADFEARDEEASASELKEWLNQALALETMYPARALVPAGRIAWGHILKNNFDALSDWDAWKQVLHHQARPGLHDALAEIREKPEFREWADQYAPVAERLLEAFTDYLLSRHHAISRRIARALDRTCPALRASPTLSRKAIRVYRSIPGIDCVLLGMREPAYVRDALTELEPPLTPEEAFEALQAMIALAEDDHGRDHGPGHA